MSKRIDYLFSSSVEEHQDEPIDIVQKLVELFDKSPEEAEQILALVDGVETFGDDGVSELLVTAHDVLLPMISEEGFSDRVRYLWEALVGWIKTVIGTLTSESLEMKPTLAALKFKAENISVTARARMTNLSSTPILLDHHVAALATTYRQPTDIAKINAGLANLIKVMQAYLDYVDRTVLPGVTNMSRQVASLDPLKLTPEWVDQHLVKAAASLVPAKFIEKIGKQGQPGSDVQYGPQMLGNVRLKLQTSKPVPTDLRSVNEQRLMLVFAELTPKPIPSAIELPRFNTTQMNQALSNVTTLVELIQKSLDKSVERKQQVDNMLKAFDRFVATVYEIPDGNRYAKEQSDQLIRLSRTLTNLLVDPYRGMVGVCIRAMRGTLYLCEKNMT